MCAFLTEIVRQKGLENITVDDLVAEITPKGRGLEDFFVLQTGNVDITTPPWNYYITSVRFCLFICLLVTSHKKTTEWIFLKNFARDESFDMDEEVN